MAEKILIVEDEKNLLDILAYNLNLQGYTIETATNGPNALEKARNINPDLILLDIMLPEMDGFEVCRQIRKDLSIPILMLTARDDEIDRVVGLEVGADDYLTKPFSMRELIARVKALLRRVHMLNNMQKEESSEHTIYTSGNLVVDETRREARLNDQPIKLKPKEYDLLLFLIKHKRQVLSRERILEKV